MEKKLTPIPGFKDHSNCQGHANWMLDCTFTTQEERDILIAAIDNYLPRK
jgi:hypothetical protein